MNYIITKAGFYILDNQWGIFANINDESWFIPTDEATCRALNAAGVPKILPTDR